VLIAHLPAGYLLATRAPNRRAFAAVLAGAMVPDLDMLWFYFVDGGARHHHTYWTHTPWCWGVLGALAWIGLRAAGRARWASAALWVVLGVGLHLALDTLVGDIRWLAPFDERFISLFTVPAVPGRHWIVSFALHWSFLVELSLVAAAVGVWAGRRFARPKRP
jgi:membrane-bound metal-dependent hydrolase YbcI (DUF457 family)